jgi:diaminopropionate ammonia-lyase
MASLAAGRILSIPGAQDSVMAGLNCGTPSLVAWPLLRDGLDAVIALDDAAALDGVRTLARGGLEVGECSGVVVAAAAELLAGPDADAHRARLQLPDEPSVLLFATEGVTDAAAFAAAAGAVRLDGHSRDAGGVHD